MLAWWFSFLVYPSSACRFLASLSCNQLFVLSRTSTADWIEDKDDQWPVCTSVGALRVPYQNWKFWWTLNDLSDVLSSSFLLYGIMPCWQLLMGPQPKSLSSKFYVLVVDQKYADPSLQSISISRSPKNTVLSTFLGQLSIHYIPLA